MQRNPSRLVISLPEFVAGEGRGPPHQLADEGLGEAFPNALQQVGACRRQGVGLTGWVGQ